MTNEELAESIDRLNERIGLVIQALDAMSKIVELHSQWLEKIKATLYELPKEP